MTATSSPSIASIASNTSTFADRHTLIVEQLSRMRDPQERLSWIVERGRRLPSLPAHLRTTEHLVPGCAARLWILHQIDAGRCRFQTDSDSAILRAVAGVLCELYDGLSPAEVATCEPTFLESTGLLLQFTENRQRTIRRVRDTLRAFGVATPSAPG